MYGSSSDFPHSILLTWWTLVCTYQWCFPPKDSSAVRKRHGGPEQPRACRRGIWNGRPRSPTLLWWEGMDWMPVYMVSVTRRVRSVNKYYAISYSSCCQKHMLVLEQEFSTLSLSLALYSQHIWFNCRDWIIINSSLIVRWIRIKYSLFVSLAGIWLIRLVFHFILFVV